MSTSYPFGPIAAHRPPEFLCAQECGCLGVVSSPGRVGWAYVVIDPSTLKMEKDPRLEDLCDSKMRLSLPRLAPAHGAGLRRAGCDRRAPIRGVRRATHQAGCLVPCSSS